MPGFRSVSRKSSVHSKCSDQDSSPVSHLSSCSGSSKSSQAKSVGADADALFSHASSVPLKASTSGRSSDGTASARGNFVTHASYMEDINFVKNQQRYLKDSAPPDLATPLSLPEVLLNLPTAIAGYTLSHQLSQSVDSFIFGATHETTGERVILKVSPDMAHINYIARFLNDWYMTSGSNPASEHRPWAILPPQGTPHAAPPAPLPTAPLTLPTGIPGILYPKAAYNVENEVEGKILKSMAVVYPNNDYAVITDFYREKIKDFVAHAGSQPSVSFVSSLSAHASSNSSTSLQSNSTSSSHGSRDNSDYVELANKVRQIPKSRDLVIGILHDVIAIFKTLSHCHKLGIVHNGITGNSILRSGTPGNEHDVVITNWDFSFSIAAEDSFHFFRNKNIHHINDLFHYMSPESASDSVTLVDYRSDIYSAGVVMYELIVGCLPFRAEDLSTLRNILLNQRPIHPSILGPEWISRDLNTVILRCLEKNPSDRYQYADDVVRDLETVIESYAHPESRKSGRPAIQKKLESYKPVLPLFQSSISRSYNQEANDKLSECFDSEDINMIVVLKGDTGVGKATLLTQLSGQSSNRHEFIVHWKYYCSDNNVSRYASALYGIYSTTKQILASSEETIAEWRKILTSQIDADLGLLYHAVPSLKVLLGQHYESFRKKKTGVTHIKPFSGPQTPSALKDLIEDESMTDANSVLPPRDVFVSNFEEQELNTELKYIYIFKKFFCLLAERGLTMVFDNIQWCPSKEFTILHEIMQYCNENAKEAKLNIIATYKSDSVADSLSGPKRRIEQLRDSASDLGWPYFEIEVKNQDEELFKSYISKMPYVPEEAGFFKRVHQYTKGNFLSFHYAMRQLKLSPPMKPTHEIWNVFDECIKREKHPETVNEAVRTYVSSTVSPEALDILKYASLISAHGIFNMADLMIVSGLSLADVHRLLQSCLETRLIMPTGICYKLPFHMITTDELIFDLDDSVVWELATKTRFRFDHDIIQIFLIEEMKNKGELEDHHRLCGLRMKKKISKEVGVNVTSYLYMASHLLESTAVAKESEYGHYYSALITGGRYAISTSNLTLALQFFTACSKFIAKSDMRRKLKIAMTQIQCNYFLKNYKESIRIIQQAEADFGKENILLLRLKVSCLLHLKEYKNGMQKALAGFKALDIEVSDDEAENQVIAKRLLTHLHLSVSEIRNLSTLKKATDQRFIVASELVQDVINPTFILSKRYFRIVVLMQLVKLMSKYGYTVACAVPLIHLANAFTHPGQHMSMVKACELTEVALALVNNDKGASTPITQNINECYMAYMVMFMQPLTSISLPKRAPALNGKNGPMNYYTETCLSITVLFMGNIRGWKENSFSSTKRVQFDNDVEVVIFNNITKLWNNELPFLEYYDQINLLTGRLSPDLEYIYLTNAAIKAYAEQEYKFTVEIFVERVFKLSQQMPMSLLQLWLYFLSALALIHEITEENEKAHVKLAKELYSCIQTWATTCTSNFYVETKLLEAALEGQAVGKPSLAVLDLYDDAIEAAEKSDRWMHTAIANLICARWLKKMKSERRANLYARKALDMYTTMNSEFHIAAIRNDFPAVSGGFNWAGVRGSIPEPERPEESVYFPNHRQAAINFNDNMEKSSKDEGTWVPKSQSIKQSEEASASDPTHTEWKKAIQLCLLLSQSSSVDLIVQMLLESSFMFSSIDYGVVVLNLQSQEPVVKAIGTMNNIYVLENESLAARTDLVPYNLVVQCLVSGEISYKSAARGDRDKKHSEDVYYEDNPSSSGLCIPIKTSTVIGALYLESHHQITPEAHLSMIDSTKIDLLYLLCSQAAVSFSKSFVYSQLEVAKKVAEEATEEKASFLANMSHEIRTPFNSLFACSLFLLDTPLSHIQKEYVETIKDSALVTLNIIDGILTFTKIEHGSFTLDSVPFSINETIEGAIMFSSDRTESELLEFAYFNKCPEIEMVSGDATRVRQIIINLVGNALKFTRIGHVKVSLEAEKISDKRFVLSVSVEDTGIGIPKDSKTKVFGAFSQVDGSSRRVYGGSGLGLAISNKLAEIMNGKISFTSTEGEGSTFVFKCPFEVVSFDKSSDIKPRTVAIISSTKHKKQALKEAMEYYSAKVELVEDLESLREKYYDIVILDKDCLDEKVHLRTYIKDEQTQIFILTRFGQILSESELKTIGADSIIFTPIKRQSIKKILEGNFLWKSKPDKIVALSNHSAETKASVVTKHAEPATELLPLEILVAEDNPVNLRVASQHLKKLGYIVDHAKDGVEVLEKCEAKLKKGGKYDVIFMDIQMPNKDGIEATMELKESFTSRGLDKFLPQIIALTANVAGEERVKCSEAGMVDFVSKPILPEVLKHVLIKVGNAIKNPRLAT